MKEILLFIALLIAITILSFMIFQCMLLKPSRSYFQFNQLSENGPRVMWGHYCAQGMRPTMEDSQITSRLSDSLVLAICDGHNGDRASKFAERHFVAELLQQMKTCDAQQALYKTTIQIDNRIQSVAKSFGYADGTTLCLLFLKDKEVYIVNLGDSRMVCSCQNTLIVLTNDHKPLNDKEIVEAAGGFVHPLIIKQDKYIVYSGPDRIYPGGLSVSRSLGDYYFKDPKYLSSIGVCHPVIQNEPEIVSLDIEKQQPDFIIIACDGLYDVVSSQNVINISQVILSILLSKHQKRSEFLVNLGINLQQQRYCNNAQLLAQILTKFALQEGSTDNVSIQVLLFETQWNAKQEKLNGFLNLMQNAQQYEQPIQAYNQTIFDLMLNSLVEEYKLDTIEQFDLSQYLQLHKIYSEYFVKQEISVKMEQYQSQEVDVAAIKIKRDALWQKLESQGLKLSQLRTTVEQRGIVEQDDQAYEIIE